MAFSSFNSVLNSVLLYLWRYLLLFFPTWCMLLSSFNTVDHFTSPSSNYCVRNSLNKILQKEKITTKIAISMRYLTSIIPWRHCIRKKEKTKKVIFWIIAYFSKEEKTRKESRCWYIVFTGQRQRGMGVLICVRKAWVIALRWMHEYVKVILWINVTRPFLWGRGL